MSIHILLLFSIFGYTQHNITGTFPTLANQPIKLVGFKGFDTYTIDSVKANTAGVFKLSYLKKDYGMGYLATTDNKPFFLVLGGENVKLKGESLANAESIKVIEGKENQLFLQYAVEHGRREQVLGAWQFLKQIYTDDSLFAVHKTSQQAIFNEIQRIKTEEDLFLSGLNPESHIRYYLPLRKLVNSVSAVAQYRTAEIPSTIAAFRGIDYTDERLIKSGLLANIIESHFWLIENSGRPLDGIYSEMNKSIDMLVENLLSDEEKLNEISEYLFKLLEKHSLFRSSEYLALKLLNEQGCTINADFASQLESYRAMKKGNTAPDFDFTKDVVAPGYEASALPKKLSDVKSKYTVVIFGASWCPQCPKELTQISKFYERWKQQHVEVVFVSLDQEEKLFKRFTGMFPFISLCDYQKWESPIVKSYHVFATPTMYLLNDKREIILRPNSANQLNAWIEWYLGAK